MKSKETKNKRTFTELKSTISAILFIFLLHFRMLRSHNMSGQIFHFQQVFVVHIKIANNKTMNKM